MAAAPPLPTTFPCWCRAIYSWGGEKKQDLGFIEGDLIECLNAGDGSWWMGRLRRDRRMTGLFPSNFVEVLPESAIPPMSATAINTPTSRSDSSRSPSPVKTSGTRSWRKPFQAYASVSTPTSAPNSANSVATPGSVREKRSLRPYASMKTARAPEGNDKAGKPSDDEAWIPAPIQRDADSRPSSRARVPSTVNGREHSGSISHASGAHAHGSVRGNGLCGTSAPQTQDVYSHNSIRDRDWTAGSLYRPRSSAGLYRPSDGFNGGHGQVIPSRPTHSLANRQMSGLSAASGFSHQTAATAPNYGHAHGHGSVSARTPSRMTSVTSFHPAPTEPQIEPADSRFIATNAKDLHPLPGQGYLDRQRELRYSQRGHHGLGHARSRTELSQAPPRSGEYMHGPSLSQDADLQRQFGSYRSRHADLEFPPSSAGGARFPHLGPGLNSRPGSAMGRPGSSMGGPISRPGSAMGRPSSSNGYQPGPGVGNRSYGGPSGPGSGGPPLAFPPLAPFQHTLSRPSSALGLRPGSSVGRPGSAMGGVSRPGSSMGGHPHLSAPQPIHVRPPLMSMRSADLNEMNGLRERQNRQYAESSRVQSQIVKFERGMGENMIEESPPPPPPPRARHAITDLPASRSAGTPAPTVGPDGTTQRLTPSPLRSALEGVMSSLGQMEISAKSTNTTTLPAPPKENDDRLDAPMPWSPEEIDSRHSRRREQQLRERSPSRDDRPKSRAEILSQTRPMSALGVNDAGFEIVNPGYMSPERSPSRTRANSAESIGADSNCASEHPGSLTPGNRGRSNTATSVTPRLSRPKSSIGFGGSITGSSIRRPISRETSSPTRQRTGLSNRKSAFELGRGGSTTSGTARTNSITGSVSGSDVFSTAGSQYSGLHSLASGLSSGTGMSATSAGSLARRRWTHVHPPLAMSGLPSRNLSMARSKMAPTPPAAQTDFAPLPSRPATIGSTGPPKTTGVTYHSDPQSPAIPPPVMDKRKTTAGGFLRRLLGGGRTIAASARERSRNRSRSRSRPGSRLANLVPQSGTGSTNVEPGVSSAAMAGAAHVPTETDWIAVRRDVNRTNSISHNERAGRAERCAMNDLPVIAPLEWMDSVEGNEGIDGFAVSEPSDFSSVGLGLVDRAIRSMPVPWASLASNRNSVFGMAVPVPTVAGFTASQLCRPYRSEVQRLRAIFCFVSERLRWEPGEDDDVGTESSDESLGRVLETGRATSSEMARLAAAMCTAVGIHAESVVGFLKRPSEPMTAADLATAADPVSGGLLLRPNHAWTMVIVGGEWRMIDCALSAASNPLRPQFSSLDVAARSSEARPVASGGGSLVQKALGMSPLIGHGGFASNAADPFWFLTRPAVALFTHVPVQAASQHIVPALPSAVQLALPVACPAYFKHGLELDETFATSDTELVGLEVAQIRIRVPADVECVADVRVPAIDTDSDGDRFETGDELCVAALCQADWTIDGHGRIEKWYVVKAVLPGDEAGRSLSSTGVLRVYAGKRGLMHSLRSNPHALALAVGLRHLGGDNPPLGFVVRHPTPQALRQDLYVVQPQCWKVQVGNTYVFSVRQSAADPAGGPSSAIGPIVPERRLARPASMVSIATVSNAGSVFSVRSDDMSEQASQAGSTTGASQTGSNWKAAKLAIQSPGGKIIRLVRRNDVATGPAGFGTDSNPAGGTWETVIKVTEPGTWRGLVLADRTARWCVFGEWECV